MIYFCLEHYRLNTAGLNRFLALTRAVKAQGVDSQIIIFRPNRNFELLPQADYYPPATYLWKKPQFGNRLFNRLAFIRDLVLERPRVKRFAKALTNKDSLYIYTGYNDPTFLHFFLGRGCKVYCEKTEHPYLGDSKILEIMNIRAMKQWTNLTGVFVISTALKQFFMDLGISEDRITILNMFADATRFDRLKKSADRERYIAYCGTVSNNKDGVEDLIKAFAIVVRQVIDVKLYIIGAYQSKHEDNENNRLVHALGLADRIVFTGAKSAAEMPQLLKDAELLVLARPYNKQAQYGFPTKLGEYLFTENPVVITRVGDIPRFLKDGESALLAEPGNLEDIAAKIIWALRHPDESTEIGRKGKLVAVSNFNSNIEAKKFLDIVQKDRNPRT